MTDIKLVATDIDGTLLNSDRSLSVLNEKTLLDLKEQGIDVALVTSRPLKALPESILKTGAVSYAITSNGAIVYDLSKQQIILNEGIGSDVAIPLYRALSDFRAVLSIAVSGNVYTPQASLKNIVVDSEEERQRVIAFFRATRDLLDEKSIDKLLTNSSEIEKIHLNFGPPEDKEAVLNYLKESDYELHITSSDHSNIELSHHKATKLDSLRYLGRSLGLRDNQIMVLGDGENDISMFGISKYSIAMKNASDEVKKYAHHISDFDNDHDGWAKAIHKILSTHF